MRKKISFKGIFSLLKQSASGFMDDKVPKMSGALAYYTVFSMGPLMIVIIFLASLFLGREAVEGSVYSQLQGFIGKDAAKQMEDMIKNASISGKGTLAATIGVITLLIGATTVFGEIQDSINSIWGLKPKPKAGLWLLIKNRLLSFGIIGSLGFLLLVSLAVTAIIEALGNRLKATFPDAAVVLFYIINLVLTLGVTMLLFAVIFKVLPDAKIKWRDVWMGAFATSLLFLLGKFAISFYISKSEIGSTYGAAGSLVILLVWVYYSAMILYFGAEFTKAWVVNYGSSIRPNEYAVQVETTEKELGSTAADEPGRQRERNVGSISPALHSNEHSRQHRLPMAATAQDRKDSDLLPPSEQPFGSFGSTALALVALFFHSFSSRKEHNQ